MQVDQKLLHDVNSCINAIEQGFFMLRESQIEDPQLKEQLLDLLSEKSKELKKNWVNYRSLEDIAAAKTKS